MSRILIAALIVAASAPVPAPGGTGGRMMAITFDDLPGTGAGAVDLEKLRSITDRILGALDRGKTPAVGFVVESGLFVEGEVDARIALLRRWIDAGLSLGNHTYSHPRLHDTPLPEYMDDVVRGDTITRMLMEEAGRSLRYFRHPYTSTGSSPEIKGRLEAFLRERGYRIAPFTIEAADYAFDAVYVDALRMQDDALAKRTLALYLDHIDTMCSFFETRSREVLGREIAQILLIHANAINAVALDRILERLERRGYRFVTLDRAMEDAAYAIPDDYVGPRGLSWIHRWTVNLGQEMRFELEPDPPSEILRRYGALRDLSRRAGSGTP